MPHILDLEPVRVELTQPLQMFGEIRIQLFPSLPALERMEQLRIGSSKGLSRQEAR